MQKLRLTNRLRVPSPLSYPIVKVKPHLKLTAFLPVVVSETGLNEGESICYLKIL